MNNTINQVKLEGKTCNVCGEFKPFTDFNKDKRGKNGLSYRCKNCNKNYLKKYYKENSERLLKQQKEYYKENAEQISQQNKKYKEAHSEQYKEYFRKYNQENAEQRAIELSE